MMRRTVSERTSLAFIFAVIVLTIVACALSLAGFLLSLEKKSTQDFRPVETPEVILGPESVRSWCLDGAKVFQSSNGDIALWPGGKDCQ